MEIIPLRAGDVAEFIRVPWHVYEGDHLWVPPLIRERKAFLDPDRNPFFQHARVQLFLARQGRRTVARLAAVLNDTHERFHGERAGFFGLFECLPDARAAAIALLGAAEAWVRERGATFLRGPVNLSTNELECGLLVEGFGSAPVFGSSYNPPYYAELIEAAGLTKCKDLLAFYRYYHPPLPPRVLRALEAADKLKSRPTVSIRSIRMRELGAEAARISAIYNEAWSDNWGFVPITEAEARHLAHQLKDAVLPDLSLLAEVDGEPIGCLVSIPDLNQVIRPMNGRLTPWGLLYARIRRRRIDTVRVALLGVKRPYRGQGIDLRLLMEIWKRRAAQRLHWELAWILEDNHAMIRILEQIGAVAYKRYRLYQKIFA
jgi:GNAT superfamily N-acetyltransferase